MHLTIDGLRAPGTVQSVFSLRPLRTAGHEDTDAVYALYARIFADPAIKAVPFNRERWDRELCGPAFDPRFWLLAHRNDTLVGYAIGQLRMQQGYIAEIGIAPEYRRGGTGRALFAALVRELASAGADAITLDVDELNKSGAVEFYASMGMARDPRFAVWEKAIQQ